MRYKFTKEQLEEAVQQSKSIASVCRILNIRPVGGNYRTLRCKIKQWNIDISHFTGQGWNVGLVFKPSVKRPLSEILIENSDYQSISKLRIRLIEEGVKKHQCEKCTNTEWMRQPIPLELNHINGNNTDNRIENLELLCSNCHAQTPNYRGKNKLSALSEKREVEFRKFGEGLTADTEPSLKNQKGVETKHGTPKPKKSKVCPNCSTEFYNNRTKYCSHECYVDAAKGKRPKVFELLDSFKKYENFTQVGKHYNVSGSAVKKWCSFYGILDMVKI
jgi:hypothetical protein